jgi:hypothetical protein
MKNRDRPQSKVRIPIANSSASQDTGQNQDRLPRPGGNQNALGRRDVSDEERIELESDPSPDEDDVNQEGAENAETGEGTIERFGR